MGSQGLPSWWEERITAMEFLHTTSWFYYWVWQQRQQQVIHSIHCLEVSIPFHLDHTSSHNVLQRLKQFLVLMPQSPIMTESTFGAKCARWNIDLWPGSGTLLTP